MSLLIGVASFRAAFKFMCRFTQKYRANIIAATPSDKKTTMTSFLNLVDVLCEFIDALDYRV